MSFKDFGEEIRRRVHKTITEFLYGNEISSYKKMARNEVKQEIVSDLKRLKREELRLYRDPTSFHIKEEEIKRLIKKWKEWKFD